MPLVSVLCRLQESDLEWDVKGRRYQALKRQLQDRTLLASRQQAQQAAEKSLAERRAELKNAELETASLQTKRDSVVQDLYGGRITHAKELENLRHERENLAARIGALEERVLELMVAVEELASQVSEGRASLEAFRAQWESEQRSGLQEYKTLRARLQALQALRQELEGQLPANVLALYHELRRSKGGHALSRAQDRLCQACHVRVPTNKARLLAARETVVSCDGCGRILYTD